MNTYNLSLVLALVTILLGVYLDLMWIGFALAIVIFVMLTFAKPKPKPKPVPPNVQQVAMEQFPKYTDDYPEHITKFHKRGYKKGDPLYIEIIKPKDSFVKIALKSTLKFTSWLFKGLGDLVATLFETGEQTKKRRGK